MTVRPAKRDGVVAHRFNTYWSYRLCRRLKADRPDGVPLAHGTWAIPAQVIVRKVSYVAVVKGQAHYLLFGKPAHFG